MAVAIGCFFMANASSTSQRAVVVSIEDTASPVTKELRRCVGRTLAGGGVMVYTKEKGLQPLVEGLLPVGQVTHQPALENYGYDRENALWMKLDALESILSTHFPEFTNRHLTPTPRGRASRLVEAESTAQEAASQEAVRNPAINAILRRIANVIWTTGVVFQVTMSDVFGNYDVRQFGKKFLNPTRVICRTGNGFQMLVYGELLIADNQSRKTVVKNNIIIKTGDLSQNYVDLRADLLYPEFYMDPSPRLQVQVEFDMLSFPTIINTEDEKESVHSSTKARQKIERDISSEHTILFNTVEKWIESRVFIPTMDKKCFKLAKQINDPRALPGGSYCLDIICDDNEEYHLKINCVAGELLQETEMILGKRAKQHLVLYEKSIYTFQLSKMNNDGTKGKVRAKYSMNTSFMRIGLPTAVKNTSVGISSPTAVPRSTSMSPPVRLVD